MKKIFVSLLFIFVMQNALAVLYTNDISNGCTNSVIRPYNNNAEMTARWTPNTHTCNANEFLPANTDGCVACPIGQTCTGGAFDFNETETQGITYTTPILYNQNNSCVNELLRPEDNTSYMIAKFVKNIHTCTPGYYLPVNVDGCTKCPVDHYCVGGTYTFNETESQGIEPCPDGTISMAGAPACYPHILHIGNEVVYLKSEKLTVPSLNIGINGNIFYANMTTIPTYMNKDSEHYLKIQYDNTIYYVCDDTTCGE